DGPFGGGSKKTRVQADLATAKPLRAHHRREIEGPHDAPFGEQRRGIRRREHEGSPRRGRKHELFPNMISPPALRRPEGLCDPGVCHTGRRKHVVVEAELPSTVEQGSRGSVHAGGSSAEEPTVDDQTCDGARTLS